jgi:hypothetical protein
MENKLNFNYLIYNIIDNFMIFKTYDLLTHIVATLALARDQGKGVVRCGLNSRPGSAIV